MVTDVKTNQVLHVTEDDRISTLEAFLSEIPAYKVKEVCIDMKEAFRKAAKRLFPKEQHRRRSFPCYGGCRQAHGRSQEGLAGHHT